MGPIYKSMCTNSNGSFFNNLKRPVIGAVYTKGSFILPPLRIHKSIRTCFIFRLQRFGTFQCLNIEFLPNKFYATRHANVEESNQSTFLFVVEI